jgi:hypothetical protein
VTEDFLHIQTYINWQMREILYEWVVTVHMQMRLLAPSVFWLTFSIIDRAIQKVVVKRSKYQLVSIAALSLACKMESIGIPYPRDLIYLTDRAYDCQELLDMELTVLKAINYEVFVPTVFHFLTRYCELIHASEVTRTLALYYAERYYQYKCGALCKPTVLAAVALYAALAQRRVQGRPMCSDIAHATYQQTIEAVQFWSSAADGIIAEPTVGEKLRLLSSRARADADPLIVILTAVGDLSPELRRADELTQPTATQLWNIDLTMPAPVDVPESITPFLAPLSESDSYLAAVMSGTVKAKKLLAGWNSFEAAVKAEVTPSVIETGVQALLREMPEIDVAELKRRAAELMDMIMNGPVTPACLRQESGQYTAVLWKYRQPAQFSVSLLLVPNIEGGGFLRKSRKRVRDTSTTRPTRRDAAAQPPGTGEGLRRSKRGL